MLTIDPPNNRITGKNDWQKGQRVIGYYCGITFTGTIVGINPDEISLFFLDVNLDEPQPVFGWMRERVGVQMKPILGYGDAWIAPA